ncbi:MAG TPA: aspartyl protease family protein [Candidatus Polarisedimenticolaceae bacterium]|nr:aspartyl protease family protein [Candidatus Polarisedimenticolaceae bacterium]
MSPLALLALAAVTRVPIDLAGNTTFVQVKVNGSGPYAFILDTGAHSSSVSPDVVVKLGLPAREGAVAHGAGGAVASSRVPGVALSVGDAKLSGLELGSFPMTAIENSAGRRIDGVLGAELFQKYIVELDYVALRMTLYEPKEFTAEGRGKGLSLSFHDNHPYVHAGVELPNGKKIEGEFVIDSGSSFPLILVPSFIEEHGVRDAVAAPLVTAGRGVGGEVALPIGRVAALRLGTATLALPVTALPQEGWFAREGNVGNIGSAILRRFRVTFDYSRKRVYLEPNERLAQPFEFDMSGLVLVTEGPEYSVRRVQKVLPKTPAEEAGIVPGDQIVSFDGKPASELKLPEIRDLLKQPDRSVPIEVLRDGGKVAVVLRTRRLV